MPTQHPATPARGVRSPIHYLQRPPCQCADRCIPVCRTRPRMPKNRPPRPASWRGHQPCARAAGRARCDGIRDATSRQKAIARLSDSALNDRGLQLVHLRRRFLCRLRPRCLPPASNKVAMQLTGTLIISTASARPAFRRGRASALPCPPPRWPSSPSRCWPWA